MFQVFAVKKLESYYKNCARKFIFTIHKLVHLVQYEYIVHYKGTIIYELQSILLFTAGELPFVFTKKYKHIGQIGCKEKFEISLLLHIFFLICKLIPVPFYTSTGHGEITIIAPSPFCLLYTSPSPRD